MVKQQEKKNNLVVLLRPSHIQTMKTMTNGATLIKKGAAEFHKLLPRCKDHPALVEDAAKAVPVLLLTLLLLLLELVEPVVVVPVGGTAVIALTVVVVVHVGVVTELGIEGDVVGSVASVMESEDADDDNVDDNNVDDNNVDDDSAEDDDVSESGEVIWVIAKAGLASPESPNTRIHNRIL